MGWMLTLWTLISVKSLYLVLLFISNSQTYVKRDIISWLIIDKGVPIVWKICHILPSVLIKSVHLKKKIQNYIQKYFVILLNFPESMQQKSGDVHYQLTSPSLWNHSLYWPCLGFVLKFVTSGTILLKA